MKAHFSFYLPTSSFYLSLHADRAHLRPAPELCARLGLLARRLDIPYPIFFVLGGLVIGFIPILPTQLSLDPQLIFFLVLPPLLYIQAFYTSWRDFRFYLRQFCCSPLAWSSPPQ